MYSNTKYFIAHICYMHTESIETPPSGEKPSTQEWVLVEVARKEQLGSAARVLKKMVKMRQRATKAEEKEGGRGSRTRSGSVKEAKIRGWYALFIAN